MMSNNSKTKMLRINCYNYFKSGIQGQSSQVCSRIPPLELQEVNIQYVSEEKYSIFPSENRHFYLGSVKDRSLLHRLVNVMSETKALISCAVIEQLISAFVFDTKISQGHHLYKIKDISFETVKRVSFHQ